MNKERKNIKKICICFISIIMIGSCYLETSYASTWGMTQTNDGSLINAIKSKANFRFEKAIDMKNGNREKLPVGSFSFTLQTISDNEYDIGKEYINDNGDLTFKIEGGKLPDGANKKPIGTIEFAEDDVFDKNLTSVLDESLDKDEIINQKIDKKTISHLDIGKDGLYDRIAKPILTPEEYDKLQKE